MQQNSHSFVITNYKLQASMITNIWEAKCLNNLWFFSFNGLHSVVPFVEIIAL